MILGDKGYIGAKAKDEDLTMKRRTTEKKLSEFDKERNRLIGKLRSPGERSFSVIKRIFGAGRVAVTTIKRVHVKMVVTAFSFNS